MSQNYIVMIIINIFMLILRGPCDPNTVEVAACPEDGPCDPLAGEVATCPWEGPL